MPKFSRAFTLLAFLTLLSSVSLAEETADSLLRQASEHAGRDPGQAVDLLTRALKLDDKLADAYYLRGREHFRLSEFQESVADFDAYVKLVPANESRQWERGISLYYAQQYQRGADQFKLYQTFHDNDVENATWRYLCMAKVDGVAKAQAALLPIKNDRRIPMMQIYELYRGKLQPKDVLEACHAGNPAKAALAYRLFYAQLYLGLYFDANGKADLARKYIVKAADDHKETQGINRYMYDVARVHAEALRKKTP